MSGCVVESAFEAKQGDTQYRYDVMPLLFSTFFFLLPHVTPPFPVSF